MKGPESGVLLECLNCFAHHGFMVLMPGWKIPYDVDTKTIKGVVWRQNTGALQTGRRFIRFGISGMPDIMGFTNGGIFLGCECKSEKGELSAMQQWFHQIALRLGGYVFVARSYQDCDKRLKEAGL